MRLAFMGTPDFAVPILAALVAAGHEIAAVYCQPPRPTGRGHHVQPSPVQRFAEAQGFTIRTPTRLRDPAAQAEFAALALDTAVVAAYGLILPKPVLEAPRFGCLNVHASLLPRWRGAAPIQRAILAGDTETGVTIMQMGEGLDTGDILLAEPVAITATTTASTLHNTLAALGAGLIITTLERVVAGQAIPRKQPEDGVTYAAKLAREEGRLDWRRPADTLERAVRALNPWPGVWFEFAGERIKVLAATVASGTGSPGAVLDDQLAIACERDALRLTLVQRPGRAPMDAAALLRGHAIPPGTLLPSP